MLSVWKELLDIVGNPANSTSLVAILYMTIGFVLALIVMIRIDDEKAIAIIKSENFGFVGALVAVFVAVFVFGPQAVDQWGTYGWVAVVASLYVALANALSGVEIPVIKRELPLPEFAEISMLRPPAGDDNVVEGTVVADTK